MIKPNLAVYVGKFDPMHRTHLVEALNASFYFDSDVRLLLVDQKGISDIQLREEVVLASIADYPRLSLIVESEDINRSNFFQKFSDSHKLYALWGLDKLQELKRHRAPLDILDNCDIITTARPGFEFTKLTDYLPSEVSYNEEHYPHTDHPLNLRKSDLVYRAWLNEDTGRRIFYVPFRTKGISGTEVRHQLVQSRDISHLMVNPLAAKIYTEGSQGLL